jgi:hypothetical protein
MIDIDGVDVFQWLHRMRRNRATAGTKRRRRTRILIVLYH